MSAMEISENIPELRKPSILDRLPDELLEKCCMQLAVDAYHAQPLKMFQYKPTCSRELDDEEYSQRLALRALCGVSKRLSNIATPILYKQLYPAQVDSKGKYQAYYDRVRERLDGASTSDRALQYVQGFRFDFSRIPNPSADVLAPFTNLHTIDLDLWSGADPAFIDSLAHHLDRQAHLWCLSLFMDGFRDRDVMRKVIQDLLVPRNNLKCIYFNAFGISFKEAIPIQPFEMSLHSLHLGDTDLGERGMQSFLTNMRCETLQNFSFCNYESETRLEHLPMHLRKNIKFLRMDFSEGLPYREATLQTTFPAVEIIEMSSPNQPPRPQACAWGFPDSLQRLTLLNADGRFIKYLVDDLYQQPSTLPKLKEIAMHVQAVLEGMETDFERVGGFTGQPEENWQEVIDNLEKLDAIMKARGGKLTPDNLLEQVRSKWLATFGRNAGSRSNGSSLGGLLNLVSIPY